MVNCSEISNVATEVTPDLKIQRYEQLKAIQSNAQK